MLLRLIRTPTFVGSAQRLATTTTTTTSTTSSTATQQLYSTSPLEETDPTIHAIIGKELGRQRDGLELIASENFASRAVLQALGSCLNNKYAEGYPGQRYYGGNQHIDEVETLCQQRALETFNLDPEEWGVNVQPLSGSPANFAALTAVLKPHDRMMGLDLPDGGHLSHGFMTPTKRVSATSVYFESMPYHLTKDGCDIDYDQLAIDAKKFKPRLIVAGFSAFSGNLDYERFRQIADDNNAFLLSDMAHTAGLIAAGVIPSNPFPHSHLVTTTTHKTLRGPRGGMIFYRKQPVVLGKPKKKPSPNQEQFDLPSLVNWSVFPGLQGGPHEHQIAAIAVALHEASKPEFKEYQQQVLNNAKYLANTFQNQQYQYQVVAGGTHNHLFLLDLRNKQIDGSRVEKLLDRAHITVNKNTVPGDTKPLVPSGLRIGTPALTTRGMKEREMDQIAAFVDRGVSIAREIAKQGDNGTKLSAFTKAVEEYNGDDLVALANEVQEFSRQFPMP